MSNILIINGAASYTFAKGALNSALEEKAHTYFEAMGDSVRTTRVIKGYDVDQEIANHQWADTILMQFPINWMTVPWAFKKYMDDVYTAGMDGRLCAGDGRTSEAPKANYGMGGALTGKNYMLSVTLNAPAEAFDDPSEPFFEGLSLDALLAPVHFNAKFFGLKALPTFAAFDVMKNPDIDSDFKRFEAHLHSVFIKPEAG